MWYNIRFGKIKMKEIGKVYVKQMVDEYSGKWILPRIPPKCEMCRSNEFYNIIRTSKFIKSYIPIPDSNYKIVCPECGDTIELEFEEYSSIKKLIKENKKSNE